MEVPRSVTWNSTQGVRSFEREDFYAFLWEEWGQDRGLVGIHEGSVLSEEAFDRGLETESWTVDSAEAPRERDWVQSQAEETAVLYFSLREQALSARTKIKSCTDLKLGPVIEQLPQDWDAEWRKSYVGVFVKPFWEVRPPWIEQKDIPVDHKLLKLNPGAGFGTGTHETTQLCLQALAEVMTKNLHCKTVLDFGSGSGILSVAAALLGAEVHGVEIDPLANDNARENAELNSVQDKVVFSETLEGTHTKYPLILANILRPVLIEFAPTLCQKLSTGSTLILSGLIESDLAEVIEKYSGLLQGQQPTRYALGDWRALVFHV